MGLEQSGHIISTSGFTVKFNNLNSFGFYCSVDDFLVVALVADNISYENGLKLHGFSKFEEVILIESLTKFFNMLFMYKDMDTETGAQKWNSFDFDVFLSDFNRKKKEFEYKPKKLIEYYELDDLSERLEISSENLGFFHGGSNVTN